MAVFYLLFSFMDLFILTLGDFADSHRRTMFICVHEWYLLPNDDWGSLYILGDNLIFYLFTFTISYIFYRIPDSHGLLVHHVGNSTSDQINVK